MPLHLAADEGHVDAVNYLEEQGSQLDAKVRSIDLVYVFSSYNVHSMLIHLIYEFVSVKFIKTLGLNT